MATARYYNEDKNNGKQIIYGVPMRDLTDEEYDALSDVLKEQVDGSPLYRKTAPTKKTTTTAPKATERAEKPVEARSDTDATEDTQDTE